MVIVMFGLNFGEALVPYITAEIWNHGGGPISLIIIVFASMVIPLPLLFLSKHLSYDASINPNIKLGYESLQQNDNDTIPI